MSLIARRGGGRASGLGNRGKKTGFSSARHASSQSQPFVAQLIRLQTRSRLGWAELDARFASDDAEGKLVLTVLREAARLRSPGSASA